jgi:hypothetical protein
LLPFLEERQISDLSFYLVVLIIEADRRAGGRNSVSGEAGDCDRFKKEEIVVGCVNVNEGLFQNSQLGSRLFTINHETL